MTNPETGVKEKFEVICATLSARPESNPIPTQQVVIKFP